MAIHLFHTLGRLILGLYFLAAGASKLMGPLAVPQIAHMTASGIPNADLLFGVAAACEVIGGVCLIIGLHVRLVAFLLAAFTGLVSWKLHAFWLLPEGDHETMVQMIMFMKNMATVGGLFAFVSYGPGPLALDRGYGVYES